MSQSSLKYRPRNFGEVVGQKKVLAKLVKLHKKKLFPNALLLSGPKGVGKTSVAKIVSLSLQCTHKPFGYPCVHCRKNRRNFPIFELNAGDITQVEKVRDAIAGAELYLIGDGLYKVYILDEVHKLSDHAQTLLLKRIEEGSSQVVWILCTTRPDKVLDTIRDRCRSCRFVNFSHDEVAELVKWLLKKHESELSSEALIDALYEAGVSGGRAIAAAVDNYVSGLQPEDAVLVDVVEDVKTKPLCRAVVKGDWGDTARLIKNIDKSQVRLFRAGVIGYVTSILLDSPEIDEKTSSVAKAIKELATVGNDDLTIYSTFSAVMYDLCKLFKGKGL